MKKSVIALILAVLQCACATQDPVPTVNNLLLSFDEISSEISVSHEKVGPNERLPQTAALGLNESR